ncbi:Protein ampG [Fibrisoma limi BUZ 3]|uniref:Protein ampG n=1 Tax=Fibrisoma limi BUZ 3 TaxID=1185876 RepID=I2GGX2_9BACT|nr:MFS transporter [Fibrisoma limi]CCH53147.1 Protein ampG [Fibrisoma limi BUZ 3]
MLVLSEGRSLRYATFFYLYVMQGIPSGFALTAVTNYLTAEGLDARAIGVFGAVIGLPWGFKFIWGPLVDRYQDSVMGQRRPWVLAAQVLAFLASLGILFIADPVANLNLLGWAFVLHGVFASLQDVSVDAMAITIVPTAERGRVNAFMKGGMATGQAIGAAGLAYLIRDAGFHTAAMMQSAVLLTLTAVTFLIRERPDDALLSVRRRDDRALTQAIPHSFVQLLRKLGRALIAPHSLALFAAVAMVFISERLFQRVFFFDLIRNQGWSDTSVSVLSGTYGTLVAVGLALVGGWLSDRFGAQRMLIGVALGMGLLHIGFSLAASTWSNPTVATTALVVRQTLEPIFSIAALPVLMGLCRRGIEGAQFAVYMALSNQADILGIYGAGQLLAFWSAPAIGVFCGLLMLAATGIALVTLRRMLVSRDVATADV